MMRKLWLLFIIGITAAPLLRAQDYGDDVLLFDGNHPFIGGFLVGLNAAQVDGDNYGGYHRAGLNAGGIVYTNFSEKAGASLELLYSQKGSVGVHNSSNGQAGSFFEKYSMKLNYAEAAVMLHYYISPKLHLNAGASYNALISTKETFDTYFPYYIDASLYPFKKWAIDGIVGFSYVWRHLIFDARYQYSITPVRLAFYTPDVARNGRDQRNNIFTFRLGYLF